MRSRRAKQMLSNKSKAEGFVIHDLKLYYKAMVINRHGNRTKIDMCINGTGLRIQKLSLTHLTIWYLAKVSKEYIKERQPNQQVLLGKLDKCLHKIETVSVFLYLYLYFSLYTKLKSNWIKGQIRNNISGERRNNICNKNFGHHQDSPMGSQHGWGEVARLTPVYTLAIRTLPQVASEDQNQPTTH